jgi:hypothetical protein
MSWSFEVPKNRLISGLILKYYSDSTLWDPTKAQTEQVNVINSVNRTILIDIVGFYISNPLSKKQIYEFKSFSTFPISSTARDKAMAAVVNDSVEVKFPVGSYLVEISYLTDTIGNVLGARFWYYNFPSMFSESGPQQPAYIQVGEAWNYSYSQTVAPGFRYLLRNLINTQNSSTLNFSGYITKLSGQQSQFDTALPNSARGMTFDNTSIATINFADVLNKIGVDFVTKADQNYKCCFGYSPNRFCNPGFVEPSAPTCGEAVQQWCQADATKAPEKQDYNCLKYKAGKIPGLPPPPPPQPTTTSTFTNTRYKEKENNFVRFMVLIFMVLCILFTIPINDENKIFGKIENVKSTE